LHHVAGAVSEFGELVKAIRFSPCGRPSMRRGRGDQSHRHELIPLEELSARFLQCRAIRVREDVHGTDILTPLREIIRGYRATSRCDCASTGGRRLRDARLREEAGRNDRSCVAAWRSCLAGELPHLGGCAEADSAKTAANNRGGRWPEVDADKRHSVC